MIKKLRWSTVLSSLTLIWIVITCYASVKVYQYDWHDDFFKAFEKLKIDRYRFLQSVSTVQPLPEWSDSLASFMKALDTYQLKHPESHFSVELLISRDLVNNYQAIMALWESVYPRIFKKVIIEDYAEKKFSKDIVIQNSSLLDPNFLHRWVLFDDLHDDNPKSITLHLSQELLVALHPGSQTHYTVARSHKSSASLIAGSSSSPSLILAWSMDPQSIALYSGYIFDKIETHFWKIFRAKRDLALESYRIPLGMTIAERSYPSILYYELSIKKRAQWYVDHPDIIIGHRSQLSSIAGDDLYMDLNINGFTAYFLLPTKWSEHLPLMTRPSRINAQELSFLFPENVVTKVIELILIEQDIPYYAAKGTVWKQVLEDLKHQRLSMLTTIQQQKLIYCGGMN